MGPNQDEPLLLRTFIGCGAVIFVFFCSGKHLITNMKNLKVKCRMYFCIIGFLFIFSCAKDRNILVFRDQAGNAVTNWLTLTSYKKIYLDATIAGIVYKLVLKDESLIYNKDFKITKMLFNYVCTYRGRNVGFFHFYGGVLGSLRLGGYKYLVVDRKSRLKHLYNFKSSTSTEDVVEIKLVLVNNTNLAGRRRKDLFEDTLRIFEGAFEIFRKEKWGNYRVFLKLVNILNIEKAPYGFFSSLRRTAEAVPSDSEEEAYKSNSSSKKPRCDMPLGEVNQKHLADPGSLESKQAYIEKLADFSSAFKRILEETVYKKKLDEMPDVTFLVSKDMGESVEGLSYNSCIPGKNRCFGTIFVDPEEEAYFHSKVLAHEIGHILGAEHDHKAGCLMEEESGPETKRSQVKISSLTRESVSQFLSRWKREART